MHHDIYVLADFSPAGSTKKLGIWLAQELSRRSGLRWQHRPFTLVGQRAQPLVFEKHMRVILAMPVYAGRVPSLLLPYLRQMRGEDAKVFLLAVYGNRHYDDALKEMESLCRGAGMTVIGGAAMIARHVFTGSIAAGRPDARDYEQLESQLPFIARAFEEGTAAAMPGRETPVYYQPKGEDGETVQMVQVKPSTKSGCIHCLQCVRSCPLGSIDERDPSRVPGKCMKCCACVLACPLRLKEFDDPRFLSHLRYLEATLTQRKEPDFFLKERT